MNLQQQVQQHLDNTGISLRELARRSGVSHNVVSRVLQGKRVRPINHNKLSRTVAIARKTLDATVEQLAAQRVNADLTHHAEWDVDLQCAKYRRVMQLEAEAVKARVQADELKTELECSRIDVRKAETLAQVYSKDLQTMQASWKAACVQVEQLQKQLDHGQAKYNELWSAHRDWEKDEAEMLAQIDTLFAERETTATLHDQQVMRLRVYVWILIAALVFVVASGLVLWGGV